MKPIIDEPLLKQFRDKHRCEVCLRPGIVQPHHIFGRGPEGCRRFDVAINLLSVCPSCHDKIHLSRIPRWDLLCIVGEREGVTAQWIVDEMDRLRMPAFRVPVAIVEPEPIIMLPPVPTKHCSGCGLDKPLDEFPWAHGRGRTWRRSTCRTCQNNYQRAYNLRRKKRESLT
jgi:hypothetical protein